MKSIHNNNTSTQSPSHTFVCYVQKEKKKQEKSFKNEETWSKSAYDIDNSGEVASRFTIT